MVTLQVCYISCLFIYTYIHINPFYSISIEYSAIKNMRCNRSTEICFLCTLYSECDLKIEKYIYSLVWLYSFRMWVLCFYQLYIVGGWNLQEENCRRHHNLRYTSSYDEFPALPQNHNASRQMSQSTTKVLGKIN